MSAEILAAGISAKLNLTTTMSVPFHQVARSHDHLLWSNAPLSLISQKFQISLGHRLHKLLKIVLSSANPSSHDKYPISSLRLGVMLGRSRQAWVVISLLFWLISRINLRPRAGFSRLKQMHLTPLPVYTGKRLNKFNCASITSTSS